ncbi:MAG: 50S ribosomal protein L14 [Candidatus Asgardarchaeia archaeon]|nr:MAG: 50S ribosomal protein L14 [Candidatus Asgardarchaeum californiense]
MPRRGVSGGKLVGKTVSRGVPVGAKIKCADNSGAKILQVIAVVGYKTRLNRYPTAAPGDMIVVSVKTGKADMRKKIWRAILVRQRKPYRRGDGTWIQFEDNAAVITDDKGNPKGSEVRGPIAREAAEKWAAVAKIASIIV